MASAPHFLCFSDRLELLISAVHLVLELLRLRHDRGALATEPGVHLHYGQHRRLRSHVHDIGPITWAVKLLFLRCSDNAVTHKLQEEPRKSIL